MGKRAVAVPMLRIVLKTQKHLTVRPVGRAPSCDPYLKSTIATSSRMIGEGHNLCLGVPSLSSAAAGGLYAAAHDVHVMLVPGRCPGCASLAPASVKFINFADGLAAKIAK